MTHILIPETADQLRERDRVLWRSIHQYDRATHDPRNYSGTILVDGVEVAQTLQCAHCLAGDTKILSRAGVKDIAAVEAGDEVMDNDGRLTTVRQVHRRTVPVFHRIVMRGGGEPLFASAEHPLLVLQAHFAKPKYIRTSDRTDRGISWTDGCFEIDSTPSFVKTEYVKPGMWIALPTMTGEATPDEFCGIPVDADVARFIGLYLAEGCIGRDKLEFGFHKKETDYIEFVRATAKRLWGANCYFEDRPNSQACKISVHSCRLEQAALHAFGRYAVNKRIPFNFLMYPQAIQESLMSGLLDGDGCYSKVRPKRSLTTISPHLAYQSTIVLRRLGYHPSVTASQAVTDKNGVRHQKTYRVSFSVASDDRKRWARRHFTHEGITWVKVMQNERIESSMSVFNLTTESHTFAANGFATHNCGSHFLNVKIPGKERGWCGYCNKPVCTKKECDTCFPFEAWLECVEKGLPPGHRPIKAAVHGEVPTLLLGK
jgi:AhpD family alkylhydroperoxidase